MDLRGLHYFSVVAEELNFTRAAQRLSMSQPPLSNQIKALEEELGTPLFLRGGRTLQLTEAGKLLYRRAAQLLDLAERTREEVGSLAMGLSGTLCLGSVAGLAPFLAARWLAGFREEYPLVRFEIVNGSSDDIIDQIQRGYIELGLIAAPYDDEHLEGIPVGSEPWCAIMSERNPLAAEPDAPLPLKEIGASQQISVKYLEQIITGLSRAGLVKAGRGSQGGYRLTRKPCEYTAGEILRAMEGSLAPIPCLDGEENLCPNSGSCFTLPFWSGLGKVIAADVFWN